MKLHNINILAAGLLAGLALASCSDSFLDVESLTESNTQTFYKSEKDANRAIIACYAAWRETTSAGSVPIYFGAMMMSDECFAGAGQADARNYNVLDRFDLNQAPSFVNQWEDDWKRYYICINRCNELIGHESQIEWNSEKARGKYMGEAHALRAICYFDLVRMFENIPLLTEPSNDNVPQADPKDVYRLIFDDFKYAAANIPADAYPKANASANEGHCTKYGAEGMMARAYLYYKGRFGAEPENCTKAEALAACEDIIKSGEYDLVPVFKNLWPAASSKALDKDANSTFEDWLAGSTYAGTANQEQVLTMKCNDTQDYNNNNDGNRWVVNVGIRGINNINCSPYGYGWGICTVNPALVKAYPAGDQRLNASVIDIAAEGFDKLPGFTEKCIADQREYTGYYIKKYTPMATTDCTSLPLAWGAPGDAMTAQWQDVIVLRYSDVLLMAAELGSPKAQDYFDKVHKRAYTHEDKSLDPAYTKLAATQENIMNERRLEFAFEGIRYYDLLRQGLDKAAEAIAAEQDVLSGNQPDHISILPANFRAKKGLCMIPNNQITLSNNVLKQNAGW